MKSQKPHYAVFTIESSDPWFWAWCAWQNMHHGLIEMG